MVGALWGGFYGFWGGAAACFWCFSVSVLLLMLGLSVFWCVRCLACLVAESENKVTTNPLNLIFETLEQAHSVRGFFFILLNELDLSEADN